MEIKVHTENGRIPVTVLHVDGNIDSSTYRQFESKVDEAIKDGARHILVDLSHAPFVSSAGLRALHSAFNKLRSLDPNAAAAEEELKKGISARLRFVNVQVQSHRVFEPADETHL